MDEFAFIDWLRRELAAQHTPNASLALPPGDDAALVPTPSAYTLFAADMLMDGVHFDLQHIAAELAGRKALAVNLSDIAAMAGRPTSVTVSLGLPKKNGYPLAQAVMRGILALAKDFGVAVAGGDTNSWDGPLVISIAVLGEPHPKGSVQRSGAQPGDYICVTGNLGGSITGKHLQFDPRVHVAERLHSDYGLTSMIDLSDGLGADLRHILTASQVGARLLRKSIPISSDAAHQYDPKAALSHALADGEDFELCFTLAPKPAIRLLAEQPFAPGLRISHIGEITAAPEQKAAQARLSWEDGTQVTETGWRHPLD